MKRPIQQPLLVAPRSSALTPSQREMYRRSGSILSIQQRIASRRMTSTLTRAKEQERQRALSAVEQAQKRYEAVKDGLDLRGLVKRMGR